MARMRSVSGRQQAHRSHKFPTKHGQHGCRSSYNGCAPHTACFAEHADAANKGNSSWWSVVPPQSEHGLSLLSAFGFVWRLTAENMSWLVVASVSLVLAALAELAVPHWISKALDASITAHADGVFSTWAQQPITLEAVHNGIAAVPPLRTALIGLAVFAVMETVFTAVRGASFSLITTHVVRSLRHKVFKVILHQDMLWFGREGNDSASLASRLSADCLAVSRLISVNLNVALRNGMQAVGGLVYLFFLNKRLAAITFVLAVTMCFVSIRHGQFSRNAASASQGQLASTTSSAEESFGNIALVQAHGYEKQEERRYLSKLGRLVQIGYRTSAAYGLYLLSYIWVWHIGDLAILSLGTAMTAGGVITPGELAAFIFYNDHVTSSCITVCEQVAASMENIGAVDKILGLLKLGDTERDAHATQRLCPPEEIWREGLSLQSVSFSYPARRSKRPALSNISFDLRPGRTTALVGKSGSGKSTLVHLLTRVVEANSGQIKLGSHDLSSVDPEWFRERLAIVPQEPKLFSGTVRENIAYGLPDVSDADVEEAARAAHAHEFIALLPSGYDTDLSKSSLSGGQKQRVAIARALLRKPRFLILDEPTSALDSSSEGAVQATFDAIMEEGSIIVVIIAHRLSTVQRCENIVVLDRGSVVEIGSPLELLRVGGAYAALVEKEFGDLAGLTMDTPEAESDDEGGAHVPQSMAVQRAMGRVVHASKGRRVVSSKDVSQTPVSDE